ncbi:hypothetical protein C0991_004275 [Blastosporella zonata]|nr:hypothetical protein C0991_004275 [Blastosporella zonata]
MHGLQEPMIDNVGVNDRAAQTIQHAHEVDCKDRPWKAHQQQARCMEHIIHLATKAFIEELNPTIGTKKKAKALQNNMLTLEADEEAKKEEEDVNWLVD